VNSSDEKPHIGDGDRGLAAREPSFYPVPPDYFVRALRRYLRDHRNRHFLFDLDYAHSDDELREAWGLALMWFNESPPRFSRTYHFQDGPRYILLKRAAAEALFSLANYMQLNETSYQDGEQSFQINQQWKNIYGEANRLTQEAENEKSRIKAEINASFVYHGAHSEFGNYFRDLAAGGPDPQGGGAQSL
jgi:hypothetical protein